VAPDTRAPNTRDPDTRAPDTRAGRAAIEHAASGHPASEDPWSTGLTGPQRALPVWDGAPGYEFEGRRSAKRPPAGPGPASWSGAASWASRPDEPDRFRYTPAVGQSMPVPSSWPRDEQATPLNDQAPRWDHQAPRWDHQAPRWDHQAPRWDHQAPRWDDLAARWGDRAAGWGDQAARWDEQAAYWDEQAEPGFEFDVGARTADPSGPPGRGPGPPPRPGGAPAEWARLLRTFLPEPVKRNWFAEFRSALRFRGAGTRVIIPIVAMMVFGVAVVIFAGANDSHPGSAPPPAALGFPPAMLAGAEFSAADNGRGISQTLGRVTSNGAEIVAVGSQQGARIARAQFFVSTDNGRSWSMGHVRTPGGGPPPPGYAAQFVAGGHGAWVAIGPRSIWTSSDGRTWTLSSTAGLPLLPGDQISVLKRTAAGFIAAGSNVPGGNPADATPVVFLSANGTTWQRLGAAQLRLTANTATGNGRVLGIRYAAAYGNRILIAGNVAVTQSGGTATVQAGAAWLSDNGGTTWTLAVPPGRAGNGAPAGHGAQAQISGEAVTAAGFILLRPATAARRPAVDVYRSANGTTWMFESTLDTPAGFVAGMVSGGPGGAVVTGQAGRALIAFVSPDGASWRRTAAFGRAAAQDVSGVTMADGGTVVTAATTTDDPDSRQPLLTVLGARNPPENVDVSKIPGATDPQLAVNDVAAGNGMQVAVGSANGYPAAWISANGGSTWTRSGGQTQIVLNRPGVQQLTSVTFGADGWLAVGGVIAVTPQHPVVLGSGNGSVWTAADREPAFSQPGLFTEQAAAGQTTGQTTGQATGQATGPASGYVIVGYQVVAGRTVAAAWWSASLTGWQRAGDATPGALDGSGASRRMLAVTAGPRAFVAVGADGAGPAAWTSADDGRTWKQQDVPLPVGAARAVLQHVASNGRTIVAVGTVVTTTGQRLPFAATSADGGTTWTESALPAPEGHASVTALTATAAGAATGTGFVATGTFGSTPGHQDVVVWTSASGTAWKAVTPAGQGLAGSGIQAITGLTVSGPTLSGVGFTATPGGEQPILWQAPVR
jgi:hypothetical protein